MFASVTKGAMSGKAGEAPHEDFKIDGQYVNTPDKGVVGIPFFDEYVEKASLDYLDRNAKSATPFFMNINFMKVHQPNMPAIRTSYTNLRPSPKFADSVVENDTAHRLHLLDKIRALGLDKNTYVFWTTDNGAWQDVYPDSGYTPFRGTKGTVREGGVRVPAIAWGPKIKPGSQESRHSGRTGLPWPTFASLSGGVKAAGEGPRGTAHHLRQLRHGPGSLLGTGKSARTSWFYFTENELTPARFVLATTKPCLTCAAMTRQATGGLAVDSKLGLEGCGRRRRRRCASGVRFVAGPAGTLLTS